MNEAHGRAEMRALENGREIPRRVQRRRVDTNRLYRRRKDRDRSRSNTCFIAEDVKRVDAHTLFVRGIGNVPVMTSNGSVPGRRGATVLRVTVARSLSKVRKLCTAPPSAVRLLRALACAASDTWAGATMDVRAASAPAQSSLLVAT